MKEYIERELLLIGVDGCISSLHAQAKGDPIQESAIKLVEATRDYIASLSAADVAPVVHGKWENKKGSPVSCYWTKDMKYLMVQEEAYCSVCGEYLNASAEYTVEGTFCPHCGAKMDQRG